MTDTISLRLPLGELIIQAWMLYKVTALPAIHDGHSVRRDGSRPDFGPDKPGGGEFLVGAASGVGIVRQGAPITAGLLMGGGGGRRSHRTSARERFVKNSMLYG